MRVITSPKLVCQLDCPALQLFSAEGMNKVRETITRAAMLNDTHEIHRMQHDEPVSLMTKDIPLFLRKN